MYNYYYKTGSATKQIQDSKGQSQNTRAVLEVPHKLLYNAITTQQ